MFGWSKARIGSSQIKSIPSRFGMNLFKKLAERVHPSLTLLPSISRSRHLLSPAVRTRPFLAIPHAQRRSLTPAFGGYPSYVRRMRQGCTRCPGIQRDPPHSTVRARHERGKVKKIRFNKARARGGRVGVTSARACAAGLLRGWAAAGDRTIVG